MPPLRTPCLISKGGETSPCHFTEEHCNYIIFRSDSCHAASNALQASNFTDCSGSPTSFAAFCASETISAAFTADDLLVNLCISTIGLQSVV